MFIDNDIFTVYYEHMPIIILLPLLSDVKELLGKLMRNFDIVTKKKMGRRESPRLILI